MILPLQRASAAEPQFAAAAVWPSPAAQTAWVPRADFQPKDTHQCGQNNATKGKKKHKSLAETGFKIKKKKCALLIKSNT